MTVKNFLARLAAAILSALRKKPAPTPVPAPRPKPVPAPQIVAPDAWMKWARHEATDGIAEEPNGDNRGPVIQRYIDLAKCGKQGDAYCSIFVNAALEQAGIRGSRSAMARSFENSPHFVKLPGPALGAIATFWRGSRSAGTGHTGFYTGETPTHVRILGANQNDDCNESLYPKDSRTFGLVDYYWPAGLRLPQTGPIKIDSTGRPVKLKVV